MQMQIFGKKFQLLTVFLVAVLIFVVGFSLGQASQINLRTIPPTVKFVNQTPPQEVTVDFKLFWDTWTLLNQQYFDKIALDPQKMFYGAIQGMVSGVGDPYTVFLPPTQQKNSKEELGGAFEGVGIELGFNKDKQLVVIAPLSGTPAEKAGILAGDLIVKIDGKEATALSVPDAVKLIRGQRGTAVALTIFRSGENDTRDIKITRDTIIVKSVEVKYVDSPEKKKIAVIKLSRFGERTNTEWDLAVSDILSNNVVGIVLDVRNNPGGLLDGAVYITSEFLKEGVVVIQESNNGAKVPAAVNRSAKIPQTPMVVLINKGSASASEIVAGALQDHGRAKLIGEQSFGKGTIQEAEDLPKGTGIHITIARWLTPDGRWVNDLGGLKPDVEVKIDPDARAKNPTDDPQLKKALEVLDQF
ncbi:MAG: S41 family peptidase [Candidatus Daviesbacteria bacterium]|nr:MAG: S41 family peptidase [Candidatus Daviesbacteria bacterium]